MSERDDIDSDSILGKNITVRLETSTEAPRYFNAMVVSFGYVGGEGRYAVYRMVLHPWLWFLDKTANCRIFNDESVVDIIKKIMREKGFGDFEDSLSGSYPTLEYVVQYRETDFAFISRLMEQYGIYYFFRHENGRHHMVLADGLAAHLPFPGYGSVKMGPQKDFIETRMEGVWNWVERAEVCSGVYAHKDYNYLRPRADLLARNAMPGAYDLSDMEIYDYPGEYEDIGEGQKLARIRREEQTCRQRVAEAEGNCRGLAAGGLVRLEEHPLASMNREYLIIGVSYVLEEDPFESGGSNAQDVLCEVSCEVIRSEVPFRSASMTPRPRIAGPQTAIVVGGAGQMVDADKYARVMVHFFWDRKETSSCRVRVAQHWAGKRWGTLFHPRIGQEVIVEFLEGDPDRPLITGRVYNGEAMPPYNGEEKSLVSAIKTDNGEGGFNELRFEDQKGQEQVFLRSERDMDTRVKNTSREWIGYNRHLIVKNNQLECVKEDRHHRVDGDDRTEVKGVVSVTVGEERHTKVATLDALDAGQEVHVKAGIKVVVEAGTNISLKVGGSFISLTPSGIWISGPVVKINSGGSPQSGSGSQPDVPEEAAVADEAEAGERTTASLPSHEIPRQQIGSEQVAALLKDAARTGFPFCEDCRNS